MTDRDEARHAQTTRQMLGSGDFIRPRMQDRDFFDKPVGMYWAQSLAVGALGPDDRTQIWPYRIPSVVGAVIAVLMTLRIGRILFDDRVGLLAAGLLAACPMTLIEAHLATADAMLLVCTTTAMATLAILHKSIGSSATLPAGEAGFWIAMAFAVLLKGPVLPAVVALTIATLAFVDRKPEESVYRRAMRGILPLRPVWGLLLAVILIVPWLVSIAAVSGGAFFHTFWLEVWAKFSRVQFQHGGPPGYYLLLSAITFWPGSLAALLATVIAFRADRTAGELFCLAWIVPAWLILELIPTKLPHYVLPLFPALALLTANAALNSVEWKSAGRFRLRWISIGIWTVGGLLLGVVWIAAPIYLHEQVSLLEFVPAIVIAVLLTTGLRLLRNGRIPATLCASIVAVALIGPVVFGALLPRLSSLWLSERASRAIARTSRAAVVIAVGYHEPSLVFTSDRTILMKDGNAAVGVITKNAEAVILVDAREEPSLLRKAEVRGIKLEEVWTSSGFNYNKGAFIRLALLKRPIVAAEPERVEAQ